MKGVVRLALLLSVLCLSCGRRYAEEDISPQAVAARDSLQNTETDKRKRLMETNKVLLKKESERIVAYAERRGWQMEHLQGVFIQITDKGTGRLFSQGDRVAVEYDCELLNGTKVAVFAIGFWKAGDTSNVLEMCSRLVILFAVITLVGLNGIHKKTWAALFTTLIVLVMIMGIFDVVIHHAEDLDYSTMEYLGSIDNPDEIFHAEILISGLGAIMDVAVAIAASLSEIVEKKPEVTFLELFKSGREIGYDIMGTMINVLLFVFGCGLIPMCLIRMNNDVSLITIIKLHIPCELCRFLVESIGIVLAIPISILVTSVMMKASGMFHRQKKTGKVQGEGKC